jgi:glucose-1-phosphate thymidylyltransferase
MEILSGTMTALNHSRQPCREVIGLVPAAGQAARLSPLPCSKELYPIGFRSVGNDQGLRPKVVCHYLLEQMRSAGIRKAYIVLRKGKWDIPGYLGDGVMVDMHLAYLMMRLPFGAPYTLDQAYPFVRDTLVALGFPDIIFEPEDAFAHLIDRQVVTHAEVVLGLFPADQPQTADMVELDDKGRVRQILVKPHTTDLRYTWIIAVWAPPFTRFMHDYLNASLERDTQTGIRRSDQRELYVGDVVQAAIDSGMRIETVLFPEGRYLDIGIPENLVKAIHDR